MSIFNTPTPLPVDLDYHLKATNWDGHSFGYSLLMINDHARNQFYRDVIGDVTGKVVLDIGAGTGLLSVIAVQQGAKEVFAYEHNRQNYEIARAFIERSGLSDRIHLICADILSVDNISCPHPSIDVIVTETFANDCFIENFAFLVEHVEKRFNLSEDCRWIPDNITLNISSVDMPSVPEFSPGVDIPNSYRNEINNAIQVFRDTVYHEHNYIARKQINMPVAQIAKFIPTDMQTLDTFQVDKHLRSRLDESAYSVIIDHADMKNPYIKVDWILHGGAKELMLNNCTSWRSIAFKVDPNGSSDFYFRFNPLTHAFIGSQL